MVACILAALLAGAPSAPAVDPAERTADMPDSWIVLFNWYDMESIQWAFWYREQWGIPWQNLVGVLASDSEHLPDLATVQAEIIEPLRSWFTQHPEIEQSTMGIILGYGLPGHYDTPPYNPSLGGFSIADGLQDMHDDENPPGPYEDQGGQRGYNWDCPYLTGEVLPEGGRLTKATMAAERYMVARIDAPTLELAKALTTRAKSFANLEELPVGQFIYYDDYDPNFPSGDNYWLWLDWAVESEFLEDAPWEPFDMDAREETPWDAFRFSIYQLWGWSPEQFTGADPGSRVLGFSLNSYGALTVRSTTDHGGCYVPNALAAGYAAAIGATAEPLCCQCPAPEILLAALREGWTLGEAYYLCNQYNDYMWVLVGDPFLRLPNWFDEVGGDINTDGLVNLQDLAGFRACMSGPGAAFAPVCEPFDFDDDGDADLADFAGFQRVFTGGPVPPVTGDFDDDSDVDLTDLGSLINCQTGVGPSTLGSGCAAFDSDFDLDVDLKDYGRFQSVFTGSGSPPHGD